MVPGSLASFDDNKASIKEDLWWSLIMTDPFVLIKPFSENDRFSLCSGMAHLKHEPS